MRPSLLALNFRQTTHLPSYLYYIDMNNIFLIYFVYNLEYLYYICRMGGAPSKVW